jgi:hypothetical protein
LRIETSRPVARLANPGPASPRPATTKPKQASGNETQRDQNTPKNHHQITPTHPCNQKQPHRPAKRRRPGVCNVIRYKPNWGIVSSILPSPRASRWLREAAGYRTTGPPTIAATAITPATRSDGGGGVCNVLRYKLDWMAGLLHSTGRSFVYAVYASRAETGGE